MTFMYTKRISTDGLPAFRRDPFLEGMPNLGFRSIRFDRCHIGDPLSDTLITKHQRNGWYTPEDREARMARATLPRIKLDQALNPHMFKTK